VELFEVSCRKRRCYSNSTRSRRFTVVDDPEDRRTAEEERAVASGGIDSGIIDDGEWRECKFVG